MNFNFIYPLVFVAIALLLYFSSVRRRITSLAILAGVVLFTYFNSLPALATTNIAALGASDRALTEEQQAFEEKLKLTPDGGHYSGIEHIEQTRPDQMPVDDSTIQETIEGYSGDNVIISVANGSVRLSGRVQDKNTAEELVEKTKAIPGVREVTFNLGLEKKAS
ncbi:BON domain-containing protein [Myxosarcina sp. GI1(2024)]